MMVFLKNLYILPEGIKNGNMHTLKILDALQGYMVSR